MPTVPDLYPVIVRECGPRWVNVAEIHQLVVRMGGTSNSPRGAEELSRHTVANYLRKWVQAGLLRQRQGTARPLNEYGQPVGRPYMEYRSSTRSFDAMFMAKGLGDAKAREILRRVNGTDSASMAAALDDDVQLRLIEDPFPADQIEVHEVDDDEDTWQHDYVRRQQMSDTAPVPSNQGAVSDYQPKLPLRPDRFFDARFTADGVLIGFDEFQRVMQLLAYVTADEIEEAG